MYCGTTMVRTYIYPVRNDRKKSWNRQVDTPGLLSDVRRLHYCQLIPCDDSFMELFH